MQDSGAASQRQNLNLCAREFQKPGVDFAEWTGFAEKFKDDDCNADECIQMDPDPAPAFYRCAAGMGQAPWERQTCEAGGKSLA